MFIRLLLTLLLVCVISQSALAAAPAILFTVAMSEAVNITGSPRIVLDVDGNTRYALYSSGSGTAALTFTYTATVGDVDVNGIGIASTSLDLNGGNVTDLNGNTISNLTFTPPANMGSVNVNYPSLSLDFTYDADGRYTLNGTVYNDLTSFIAGAGATFNRASTATYFNSSGIMQTAASSSPRFTYDPTTLTFRGLLIEEGRTNLVTYSVGNGAPWEIGNVTTTANAGTAPDNTNTATLLTTTGVTHYHREVITVLPSTLYTFSFWAKRGTMTDLKYSVYNWTAGSDIVASTSYYSQTNASTWSRVSVTFTTPAGCTSIGVYPLRDALVTGTTYVWGAQLEQGGSATSYIPTTTASVTRAADDFTIPVGAWHNTPAGTLFAQGRTSARSVGVTNAEAIFSGSSYSELVRGASTIALGGFLGAGAFTSTGVTTANFDFKMTGNYQGGTNYISLNGAAPLSVAGSNYGPPTLFGIGRRMSAAWYWNSTIEKIKYYPVSVSNAQLQLLSQ